VVWQKTSLGYTLTEQKFIRLGGGSRWPPPSKYAYPVTNRLLLNVQQSPAVHVTILLVPRSSQVVLSFAS